MDIPKEYFHEKWWEVGEETIEKLSVRIQKFDKRFEGEEFFKLYVDTESAGQLWMDFRKACETYWLSEAKKDPYGWTYQPIKRYAEIALKLAGIYTISRRFDQIPEIDDSIIKTFLIEEQDMKRAIHRVLVHHNYFSDIIQLRLGNPENSDPNSQTEDAKVFQLVQVLLSAPNRMLNVSQWREEQSITGNTNYFVNLTKKAEKKGFVRRVKKEEITNPREVDRLALQQPATKVYTTTEAFLGR